MRIALICNMNNNNFALMRYLRDLGEDAHLFLFSDELAHFLPENDTWEYDKWRPYIHRLDFRNSQYDIILKTGRSIAKQLRGFDAFIGSGLAPALLAKAGIRLDIFYPYGIGIEFAGDRNITDLINNGTLKRRLFYSYIRSKQVNAIHNSKHCIYSGCDFYTEEIFESVVGRPCYRLQVPMVYNSENINSEVVPVHLLNFKKKLQQHSVTVVSHARHWWHPSEFVNYTDKFQGLFNKHNEWLINGFSQFVHEVKTENPLLILYDYGPNAVQSRQLSKDLVIEKNVLWMPKSSRREILYMLGLCDIGVGEFPTAGLWGGTGWETLSAGKPLLQSINLTDSEFTNIFGYPLPPILDVKSAHDVTSHLFDFVENRARFVQTGHESKRWFNEHNGINLAAKYLKLLGKS